MNLRDLQITPTKTRPPTEQEIKAAISEEDIEYFASELLIEKRLNSAWRADPDPYELHKLSLNTRLEAIENFLLTGQ